MKKFNLNSNKTKLIARVMLVVLLFGSAIFFSSCLARGYLTNVHIWYYSHDEFAEFIEQYGEKKQDIFVPTFISFDLDNVEGVEVDLYDVWTVKKVTKYLISGEKEYEDIYGESHKSGFRCIITFYMNDYSENGELIEKAYEITCTYTTKNYNFNKNDPMRIEFVSVSKVSQHAELYINDIEEVDIRISSKIEPNQEKLDEIAKILMDNIIIINRGDLK